MCSNKPLALTGASLSLSCKDSLERLGFDVITLPPYKKLGKGVDSHADMLIFPIDDKIFTYREYAVLNSEVFYTLNSRGYNIVYVSKMVGNKYPNDIALNVLCIDKILFGRIDFIAEEIKEYAKLKGYDLINVNQGYARCTAAPIGNSGIITADSTIAKAAKKAYIDVLEISDGAVRLPPFNYGFIGGASGFFSDKVYFAGDIATHSSYNEILNFLAKHKKEPVSLSDEPLNDIGSIFFLE